VRRRCRRRAATQRRHADPRRGHAGRPRVVRGRRDRPHPGHGDLGGGRIMAGDPRTGYIWPYAELFVGPLAASPRADVNTPFGPDWDLVGLLDGEQGFSQEREEEVTDHYAWGGILVRTSRRNFKLTVSFQALEDNDVVRGLVWPASPPGEIVVPRPPR